jgi:hypothetical protein
MKVTASTLAVALFVAAAQAQNSTSGNSSDYATGLVAALNGAGLTTLAGVLGGYPDIAQMLQMGGNYTVSSVLYKLIHFMLTLDRRSSHPTTMLSPASILPRSMPP